jgi:hypothetical protein
MTAYKPCLGSSRFETLLSFLAVSLYGELGEFNQSNLSEKVFNLEYSALDSITNS